MMSRVGESRDGRIDVRIVQRGRHLGPDARLALGDDRKEEAGHIDAALVERLRHRLCTPRIVELPSTPAAVCQRLRIDRLSLPTGMPMPRAGASSRPTARTES